MMVGWFGPGVCTGRLEKIAQSHQVNHPASEIQQAVNVVTRRAENSVAEMRSAFQTS
jgi:hypothetical protein